MRLILDSNVGVKFVLPEIDSPKALLLRSDIRAKVHDVIAPDVFPVELGHALTRAERPGRISQAAGYSLWLQVMKDCPHLHPSLPLMPRAFDLSSQFRVGIYDCLYVALSEAEQCPLVTADIRMVNVFQGFRVTRWRTSDPNSA